jgi:peptide/nickel transport system permease protein
MSTNQLHDEPGLATVSPGAPARARRRGINAIARRVGVRVGAAIVTIFGVLTLVFVLSRVTGDPAVLMSPPGSTAEQIQNTRHLLGLDRSIPSQYVDFLSHAVRGNLGRSYFWRIDALRLVLSHVGATLWLALGAAAVAVVLGVLSGMAAAFRRGRLLDRGLSSVAMLGQAIPAFWLGPVLILIFSVHFRLLPASGRHGAKSFILPIVTLSLFQLAVVYRITRAAALDSLGQDYVTLGRAKGSGDRRLAFAHVLPNSALPVLTVAGLALANLIGGSVIVETIFGWPGIGALMIQAVQERDFPVVQAVALVFSIGYITINTLVDVLYEVVDPRVRARATT